MCYTELKVKQKINVWHLIFQAMTHCYQDTSPLHVSWTNFTIIGNIKISWSNIRITASTKFLTLERTFRTAVIAYLSDDFSEKISPGSSESVKKQALKRVPIVSWLPQYNTLVSRLSHHPSHHHCHHHSHNFPEIVKVLILLITWHHWGCLSHKQKGARARWQLVYGWGVIVLCPLGGRATSLGEVLPLWRVGGARWPSAPQPPARRVIPLRGVLPSPPSG